jgi:sec-independent protein translocase protein TatA
MMSLAAFGLERIGFSELLIVLLIVLLLFGARKLPDLARALGRSLGEFKKGRQEGERAASATPPPPESDPEKPEKTTPR